jgi:uncharacterized protein
VVKADPFTQRRVLDLAEVDRSVAGAEHRRATMPELAEIAAGNSILADLRTARITAETEVGDLDRDARKLDTEIEQVRARAERDRQRLAAGAAAKELENLEHEVASLARRQASLEDDALELMERRETADASLAAANSAFETAASSVIAAEERRDTVLSQVATELENLARRRAEVAAPLPADLSALYERIRSTGKTAAGELKGSMCGACHYQLNQVDLAEIRSAAADLVVRCPECGAILVRA